MTATERPDDRLLVEQARRGSSRAFQGLVERYQSKVYALALGFVRNKDEARDVAQDAFLKAHQSLDKFQGGSSFYTWLYRITVNLCIDQLRKAGRGGRVEFDERLQHEEAGSPADELAPRRMGFDPDQALRDKELRGRLQGALAELSEPHRAVLLLREVDGLSYKEMADVLGCAEGTIMSRLFHARKRMQELLRGYVEAPAGAQTPGEEAAE
jgi:RNA polymerase sigma-70 factor, ECF subfamily